MMCTDGGLTSFPFCPIMQWRYKYRIKYSDYACCFEHKKGFSIPYIATHDLLAEIELSLSCPIIDLSVTTL